MGKHEKPVPPGSKPLPIEDKPAYVGKHEGKDKDQQDNSKKK